MPTNSSASALRDGTSRIAVCCRRHSLQLKHKWLRRHEPKWRSSAAVRPASQFRQAVVSRWDKFFVMDDPPDYEPAPEKSLATIAARSGRPPDEVAYDYITEADAYRYSVFGALSHGNSGANARWIMKERRAPAAARVSAAIALLDRGWGKPQQAIEMDWRQKPASLMTDEELMAIARGGAINA
jgi:hypothetical protein